MKKETENQEDGSYAALSEEEKAKRRKELTEKYQQSAQEAQHEVDAFIDKYSNVLGEEDMKLANQIKDAAILHSKSLVDQALQSLDVVKGDEVNVRAISDFEKEMLADQQTKEIVKKTKTLIKDLAHRNETKELINSCHNFIQELDVLKPEQINQPTSNDPAAEEARQRERVKDILRKGKNYAYQLQAEGQAGQLFDEALSAISNSQDDQREKVIEGVQKLIEQLQNNPSNLKVFESTKQVTDKFAEGEGKSLFEASSSLLEKVSGKEEVASVVSSVKETLQTLSKDPEIVHLTEHGKKLLEDFGKEAPKLEGLSGLDKLKTGLYFLRRRAAVLNDVKETVIRFLVHYIPTIGTRFVFLSFNLQHRCGFDIIVKRVSMIFHVIKCIFIVVS
eukprot:TRINITY_DN2487_c0_g1::TRINITY_DN2487_c0_g1_i1::g.8881::m.8881 TRINITY_DN2487_c0_g1::TRINITY_DN2487_c0_g1_i1::g.8881  ORF type:complete len:391 (+),score=56.93,NAD_binding_2/PF03446.10/1.2e+03,NAD_binding_2/PF03446.10/0.13,Fapy_DNA_glyco/PF01149.19/1.4,Fapy_DNA_glyco/PF01149.19/1.9e+02,PqqD/PF05402.7/1.3,PqqD/PF05402.7/1.9e+02,PqqD/PF05402.7/1.9e+03,Plasmid_stabil/PF05016.9/1.3e+03,Plasmid_stabil/PF05016.9/2.4,Plasmid_stabil/PF05016.9/1.3e+03 TRINITY_DN2487_c0_g1_i1:75-1247(+)